MRTTPSIIIFQYYVQCLRTWQQEKIGGGKIKLNAFHMKCNTDGLNTYT